MAAGAEIGRELAVANRLLESGEWVLGQTIIDAIADCVPPGRALRMGYNVKTRAKDLRGVNPEAEAKQRAYVDKMMETDEGRAQLIAAGRRTRAVHAINSKLRYGTWESDPVILERMHWRNIVPFYLRLNPDPTFSMGEVATLIGVPEGVLRDWIHKDLAPPAAEKTRHVRSIRLEKRWLPVYQQIAAVYTPGAKMWAVDPRSFWHPSYSRQCPNCGTVVQLHGEREQQEEDK